MARRIKKASIRFISLVPKGANNIATIFKDDGTFDHALITKDMNEKGELIAAVYSPERKDTQGDIASAEVIKDAAYEAAKAGFNLDIRHNETVISKDKAFVAETFIIQKNDPRFADMRDYHGTIVDVTHGWGVVIKIEDPQLRQQYREGKWQGVSMGGTALVEQLKEQPPEEDFNMNAAELEAALAKSNAALATTIVEGITKAMKPAAPVKGAEEIAKEASDKADKARRATLLKGGDARGFKRAALVLRKERIAETVDLNDAEALEKATEEIAEVDAALAEIDKEIADAKAAAKGGEGGAENPNQARIEKLETELRGLRSRSQQPVAKEGDRIAGKGGTFIGVEKTADSDPSAEFAAGTAMARAINEANGFAKPVAA